MITFEHSHFSILLVAETRGVRPSAPGWRRYIDDLLLWGYVREPGGLELTEIGQLALDDHREDLTARDAIERLS